VFNLFLDRLRGKHRGVTALVRYPLRLLTLQQARRLMRILAKAELVRIRRRVPGAPFEIGFWVGSGNTPNRAAQGFGGVPAITLAGCANDDGLLSPPQGDTEADRAARRRSERYKETLEAYDKLRTCPCCDGMALIRLHHTAPRYRSFSPTTRFTSARRLSYSARSISWHSSASTIAQLMP
jgi:hypothetical protein